MEQKKFGSLEIDLLVALVVILVVTIYTVLGGDLEVLLAKFV
ncbi:hypothetical protein [Halanaerobaculum tunisiense]